jgi:D-alanyl-D-alanine carboxypeptidase
VTIARRCGAAVLMLATVGACDSGSGDDTASSASQPRTASQPVTASEPATTSVRPTSTAPGAVTTATVSTDELARQVEQLAVGDLVELSGAVLVAVDGETVVELASGTDATDGRPLTTASRFRLGSITKQFTAAAVMELVDRGLVDPAESVCEHLPECPPAWEPITIEMAVAHMSGIPEYTALAGFDPMAPGGGAPGQMLDQVRDLPLEREPGSGFSYNNSGYAVLGAIIEAVSGRSYEDFLEAEVLGPLRMTETGYDSGDDAVVGGWSTVGVPAADIDMSWPYAAGGMYSTVGDLLRWDAALASGMLLRAGAGARLIEPIEMITDRSGVGYAWGAYVGDVQGEPIVYHGGSIDGFSTVFLRHPERKVTVAILTNREDAGDLEATALAIARLVLGR